MKRLSMAMTGLAVLGLMTMVSCRKPNVNNAIPGAPRTVTFNATTESNGGSKTYLEGRYVKWSEGDKLNINGATFTLSSGENTTSGSFTGTITGSAPYLAGYPQSGTTYTAESKSLKLNLPVSYEYNDSKVEIPMVAITNSENGNLSFSNAVNVLKLKLKGDGSEASKLTSIVLKSSTSAINGDITVTFNGETPTFKYADGTTTTTVNFTGGKQLTSAEQYVYVVLPKINGGELTIKFNCSNGKYMEKKITVTPDFNAVNNSPGNSDALTVDAQTELVETDEWINFNDATMGVSGLPKLAKKNMGATCSTENTKDPNTAATWYGDYYAWGATTTWYDGTASSHTWKTGYSDGYVQKNDPHYDKKWYIYTKYTSDDGKTTLDNEDDVARALWGDSWRMPTSDEWKQLKENTLFVWTDNYKGISNLKGYVVYKVKATAHKGQKVTSSGNGDYNYRKTEYALTDPHMFLPIAGRFSGTGLENAYTAYYWSKSIGSDSDYASYLFFTKTSNIEWNADGDRYYGCSVRPVQ